MTARVTLITKNDCYLCHDARAVVNEVCEPLGILVEEVPLESDPHLQRLYGEQVPVVLVDGAVHGFWQIDAARLRSALV